MLRILAYKRILEKPQDHGFILQDKDYYVSTPTNDILIEEEIPNLAVYAKTIGTNYHQLKTLNPWIKGNELKPAAKSYKIKAPRK